MNKKENQFYLTGIIMGIVLDSALIKFLGLDLGYTISMGLIIVMFIYLLYLKKKK